MDCTAAMIATDGQLLPDAPAAADRLDIEICELSAPVAGHALLPKRVGPMTFNAIRNEHVKPLEGTTITDEKGESTRSSMFTTEASCA